MEQDALIQQLILCLEKQVTDHQTLVDLLQTEKDVLIGASTEELNQLNRLKEELIQKIRMNERQRVEATDRLSRYYIGLKKPVSISDLVKVLPPIYATELKQIQLSLKITLERIQEKNRQNEVLVNSSLRHVRGAIHSMKEHLQINPTYKKEGGVQTGVSAGQLVRREA